MFLNVSLEGRKFFETTIGTLLKTNRSPTSHHFWCFPIFPWDFFCATIARTHTLILSDTSEVYGCGGNDKALSSHFFKRLNGLVSDVCRFEEWMCGKSPLNLSFWFNGVMFSCSLDKRFFGAKSARIGGCSFTWRLLQEVNIFFSKRLRNPWWFRVSQILNIY